MFKSTFTSTIQGALGLALAFCAGDCGSDASHSAGGSGAQSGSTGLGVSGASATAGAASGVGVSGATSASPGSSANTGSTPGSRSGVSTGDGAAKSSGASSGIATTSGATFEAGTASGGTAGSSMDAGLLSESGSGGAAGGPSGSSGSATGGANGCADGGAGALPWPIANMILCQTLVPTFPSKICTLTDNAYGGSGDGITDDTAAFQKAIADCSKAGGGHVVVPSGTFVSGAIELLDNVDLHLMSGATIKFSGDVSRYPLVVTRYEGIELMNHSPMIYAYKRTNIGITGPGVLDASGTSAWNVGSDRTPLETYANNNTPVSQRAANGCCRSTFVEPYSSDKVLIQGITLKGAQFWQIHPTLSTNVTVDGITVTNSGKSNNDGFDPESSDHVVLTNSTIQVNDDAIAIKSGRDADGRRINVPSSNFVFMHSSFSSTVGLMTLGSELSGGIHDVYGYDLNAISPGVSYVLQIKGNTLRGGTVTDIHIDTVSAINQVKAGVINSDMHYKGQTGTFLPTYGNFSISNAKIDGAPNVLQLGGVSAADPIGKVDMSNSTYSNIANPVNSVQYATVLWTNVSINGSPAK